MERDDPRPVLWNFSRSARPGPTGSIPLGSVSGLPGRDHRFCRHPGDQTAHPYLGVVGGFHSTPILADGIRGACTDSRFPEHISGLSSTCAAARTGMALLGPLASDSLD